MNRSYLSNKSLKVDQSQMSNGKTASKGKMPLMAKCHSLKSMIKVYTAEINLSKQILFKISIKKIVSKAKKVQPCIMQFLLSWSITYHLSEIFDYK